MSLLRENPGNELPEFNKVKWWLARAGFEIMRIRLKTDWNTNIVFQLGRSLGNLRDIKGLLLKQNKTKHQNFLTSLLVLFKTHLLVIL